MLSRRFVVRTKVPLETTRAQLDRFGASQGYQTAA